MTRDESCRDCRDRLSLYLEGELPAAEAEILAGHMRECPSCREELDILKKTVGVLRDLPPVPPPPEILAEVRKTLYHRPAWKVWLEGWTRPAWVKAAVPAAAMLIVVSSIIFVQQRYPGLEEEARHVSEPGLVPAEPRVVTSERAVPPPEEAEGEFYAEPVPAAPDMEAPDPQPEPAGSPGSADESLVKKEAGAVEREEPEAAGMEVAGRIAKDAATGPPAGEIPEAPPSADQPAPEQDAPEEVPAPGSERLETAVVDEVATRPEAAKSPGPPAVVTPKAVLPGNEPAPEEGVIVTAAAPEKAPETAALSGETLIVEKDPVRGTGQPHFEMEEKPDSTVVHQEEKEAGKDLQREVAAGIPPPPVAQTETKPREDKNRKAEKKKAVLRQDRASTADDAFIPDEISPAPRGKWAQGYAPPVKGAAPPARETSPDGKGLYRDERRESSSKSVARDYYGSAADQVLFLQAPAGYDYKAHLHREVAGLGGRILAVRPLDEDGASRISELTGPAAAGKPLTGATIGVHLPARMGEKFFLFIRGETPMTTLESRPPPAGDREFLTILIHIWQPA